MKNMKVLLLSPHTDDVELGAGATVAKLIEEGHNILWIVFSTAKESVPKRFPEDTLKKEFLEVVKKMGLKEENYTIKNFRVRYFHERRQDILEDLIKIRNQFNPDLVMMPSLNDFHQDHHIIAEEGLRAFNKNSNILGYELPWNKINFSPTLFSKIDEAHLKKKLETIKCYETQINLKRRYFSEEFIKGLAKVRGVQSNTDYAEAFEVIRWRM